MSDRPRTNIVNGRVIDPEAGIDEVTDLQVSEGRILNIGAKPQGFVPDLTIDATGRIVCPGLIDLCARPWQPGKAVDAILPRETHAAVRNGITTICCPPDTETVTDSLAKVKQLLGMARQSGSVRLLPIGALTEELRGRRLSNMVQLQQAGCVALSNGNMPLANSLVERHALEYAATFGLLVMLRAEDSHLRNGGCVHEGPFASRLGLPGIPETAEIVAVARDLALAEHSGCRIHLRGLSSGTAAKNVALGRQHLPITADVAAYQLHLTEMDIDGFDSNCHVAPPLRSLADRDALRQELANGTISAICSDHQPHTLAAKSGPFATTAAGISGLDTLLSLTLKLVDEGVLGLADALARVTSVPADILSLELGRLTPGFRADICIFDPDRYWLLQPEAIASSGHNTPFLGWELRGRTVHTLRAGKLVFSETNETK